MKKVLYILAELDDGDVAWMSAQGRRDTLRPGEALITQGVATGALYFVLEGRFAVTVDGTEVARVGAGEVLGEISFVDRHPPTATVTALDAARVLAIPKTAVERKLETDPPFAARFYRALATFMADRLRATLGQVGSAPRSAATDELDLDRLERISRAGERFERVLRTLAS